jgi:hypothetical protein
LVSKAGRDPVGQPGHGEALEPQVSAERHRPDDRGGHPERAEPPGLGRLPQVGGEHGQHEQAEADEVDGARDLEDHVAGGSEHLPVQ